VPARFYRNFLRRKESLAQGVGPDRDEIPEAFRSFSYEAFDIAPECPPAQDDSRARLLDDGLGVMKGSMGLGTVKDAL
jgi:hypothetical protein